MIKLKKDKWQRAKLGEVCEIFNGSTPLRGRDEYWNNGTIPWFTIDDIREQGREITYTRQNITELAYRSTSVKLIPPESVLLCCTASIGEYAMTKIPLTTNQQFNGLIIKDTKNLNPYYLFHYSAILKDRLMNLSGKTTIDFIPIYRINEIDIPLPPIDEQARLVELFQSIEQSIVHTEEQEKSLLILKNQLLRELFGEKKKFGTYLTAKDYEKVKFDKIALNISERVEPKQTGLDIYVGLEHLDSDDLAIRRRGKPEDVIGTKLKIYKGDIIFGKRRAYLRKVAVSDFEGIASAHSMVLRANEEYIERDFLPYFMQSDEFMNRAMQISEGSLSPTIKWKTLAQQEFVLPKKDKQAKLIDIFKQFDETRELVRKQKDILKKLKQILLNEILGG